MALRIDLFYIVSGHLSYQRFRKSDFEIIIEADDLDEPTDGTLVVMMISTEAQWTTKEVFDRYQTDDLRFRRTHVPIILGKYPNEQLVSRSQAKRILTRFDQFSEVYLDFSGIQEVGPAFIDEIFRVYRLDHPEIILTHTNAVPEIEKMILNALKE